MRQFAFSEDKFRELVLYVIRKGADDPSMGATKLNKVLYFCDFLAYANFATPITGATYQRLDQGPAPRQLLPAREAILGSGDAVMVRIQTPLGVQDRLYAKRPPDLSVFTADEISLVDQVMEWLRYHNADDVSELSHREVGWQIFGHRETIPYETVFISSGAIPDEAVIYGQEVAQRLNLASAPG